MDNLLDLYQYAEDHCIDVDWIPMQRTSSLSVVLPDGSCSIALDQWKMDTVEKELICLAHELGHCETGSFYTQLSSFDVRQKHENRADKWAIKKLISEDELDQAIADGYTDLWSLAEHFGITEDFMRKAVCLYTQGNLATDLYF